MQSFRVKLPTLWRQAFPGLVLGAVLARASLWLQGTPFSWPDTLPLMGIAAILVMAIHLFQPTLCGPAGLKAMTAWGMRRSVSWSSIQGASFARLHFLQPSIKLTDTSGRSYWIALDTKDLAGLHKLAHEHGGPAHPLTLVLERPLYAL